MDEEFEKQWNQFIAAQPITTFRNLERTTAEVFWLACAERLTAKHAETTARLEGELKAREEELALSWKDEPCGHPIQCLIGDEYGHYTCQWCAELAATRAAVLEQAAEECVKLHANCDKSNVACHVLDEESIRALITQPDADALAEAKRAARLEEAELWDFHCANSVGDYLTRWTVARLAELRAPVSKPKEKPNV